jgi:iron complex outermembrane receptor protein
MQRLVAVGLILTALILSFFFCVGFAYSSDYEELATLELEELMDVEVVTTSSRRTEPLTQVAGAVVVLDQEDIFHSGATTLPEVLKLVPGVHVSQMDLDKWAIGIRGFDGILSNKHLVMIDGRPITSPTTGDVSWGNNVSLSDIKRIEIVRGTWTHLWGVDSFTGVINVITKTAAETQGGQSVTVAGTSGIEQSFRYGGSIGDNGHYRAYVGGWEKNGNWTSTDEHNRSSSDWSKKQGEVRVDWENAFTDSLSFQGGFANGSVKDGAGGSGRIYMPHMRNSTNAFGQFTWNRALGLDSGINFRTSYTYTDITVDDLKGGTNTMDADLEYGAEQNGIHRMTMGIGSRYYWDDISSGTNTSIDRLRRYTFAANGFVQDRITLSEDSTYLTLGTKLDLLSNSQVEVQPTIRLLRTYEDMEFWGAISRAVRADTRWQRSGSYRINVRGEEYTVYAPDSLSTEKLISYEAGYRQRVTSDLHWDMSVYINEYDELIMLVYDKSTRSASLDNSLKGTSYGLETFLEWDANEWLAFTPSASVIYQNIYGNEKSPLGNSMPEEGVAYELKVQTRIKTTDNTGFDFLIGYMKGPTDRNVPGYLCLEAHTYWKATDTLMLELIGRNLSEASEQYSSLHVGPSADLRVTWNF